VWRCGLDAVLGDEGEAGGQGGIAHKIRPDPYRERLNNMSLKGWNSRGWNTVAGLSAVVMVKAIVWDWL
jgi:hypothetical protein